MLTKSSLTLATSLSWATDLYKRASILSNSPRTPSFPEGKRNSTVFGCFVPISLIASWTNLLLKAASNSLRCFSSIPRFFKCLITHATDFSSCWLFATGSAPCMPLAIGRARAIGTRNGFIKAPPISPAILAPSLPGKKVSMT